MNSERIETLHKLLQMDPNDTFSRYALGLEYLEEAPEQAREHFQEVARRDPDYVAAYFQLGKAWVALEDREAARGAWESGLEVAQRIRDWHTHGELEEALADL